MMHHDVAVAFPRVIGAQAFQSGSVFPIARARLVLDHPDLRRYGSERGAVGFLVLRRQVGAGRDQRDEQRGAGK